MRHSLAEAFIRYHRGLGKMPIRWKPWLFQLLLANMLLPPVLMLLFPQRAEPFVVFGVSLVGGATFVALTAYFGFTRILGFAHISWIPLIVYLWLRLDSYPLEGATGTELTFAIWLRMVLVLDVGSLVLDAANVIRYFRGDREEMVTGLDPDVQPEVESQHAESTS